MSELRVRITGDAAGFKQTLNTAKTDAAKFNQQLVQQSNQLARRNQLTAQVGQAATRGIGVANAASTLGGIPGTGQAGQAIAAAAGGFWGLKELATTLGVGMAKAAGVFAVFVGAIVALTKLYEEAYGLQKVLQDQLESEIRASAAKAKTDAAYIDVLKKNKAALGEAEYERLRRGVLAGDRGAMAEIRGKFGGTVFNEELKKELVKAQIAAMPEGARKDIAEERLRYSEAREAIKERIGGRNSQATQAIARQLFSAVDREHQNRLAEINKKQLDELKKINQNTKSKPMDNPFR